MPKLYLTEYSRSLAGKTVFIACREGILRDYFKEIIADIRFLDRQDIGTVLFHNIPQRFANQKLFRQLETRLFNTQIIRVPADQDFYQFVLNYRTSIFKIIFMERKFLVDDRGRKINCVSTRKAKQSMASYCHLIASPNFRGTIEQICHMVEAGNVERVHILPAGKNKIKHELFSIEGTGTLIANNFEETFSQVDSDEEVDITAGILKLYRGKGFLKKRSKEYIDAHRHQFFVAKIDGIIVGCLEKIVLTPEVVELGALAVSTKFRNQQIGFFLVDSFIKSMRSEGFKRMVALTNNPKLQDLFLSIGFKPESLRELRGRQADSKGVQMFHQQIS